MNSINHNKYNVIDSIENDAPFGSIPYYSITFLTPQRIEGLENIPIKGFKVHQGYSVESDGKKNLKLIKESNDRHDTYLADMGKLYAWDDSTKVDEVEYGNTKLNDLERTRRENVDKLKLVREQFGNEYNKSRAKQENPRQTNARKRLQERLYKKGLISREELDMITEKNTTLKQVEREMEQLNQLYIDADEAWKDDYLEENASCALKFGIISIYSPKHIGGLKTLCFKVRGLFQSVREINKRVRELEQIYPKDTIYKFEIGKWCPYTDSDGMEHDKQLKLLNYAMKCHNENMENEQDAFHKRKEDLIKAAENEGNIKKRNNKQNKQKGIVTNDEKKLPKKDILPDMGTPEDADNIYILANFLNDSRSMGRFDFDTSTLERTEVDINN
jgi:hypothetical protein